jgi:hypothetical protein
MAKTDWKKLEQEFQRAHAKSGIKLQDWCEQKGISYATARRHIKMRRSAQTDAQKKMRKTAQSVSEESTTDEGNRSNPTNAITGEIILKAMRKKQKARLKKERGLALNRKDEHLRVLGRFGDYEPWG